MVREESGLDNKHVDARVDHHSHHQTSHATAPQQQSQPQLQQTHPQTQPLQQAAHAVVAIQSTDHHHHHPTEQILIAPVAGGNVQPQGTAPVVGGVDLIQTQQCVLPPAAPVMMATRSASARRVRVV